MQHPQQNGPALVSTEKQSYTAPTLIKLGSIADLTQFDPAGSPFDGIFGSSAS
jgi:hypothetical protein